MTTRLTMALGNRRPRILAGRFSRAERVRQRHKIDLDECALTPQTQQRYYLALRKLLPFYEKAKNDDHLDALLCKWIRKMWREGEPMLTIGDGLSALHFFQPWTRRRIPHAWKLFAVWKSVELPSRAPPMTRRIVRSMAAYEWQHDNFEMAIILVLAFHCLLRTGEALQLTPRDFMLGSSSGICSLKSTKSGQRNAVDEAISIHDPIVLEILRIFLSVRRQQHQVDIPIWSSTQAAFRLRFRHLCHLFDLGRHNFRPYSLRRGGATEHFQRTNSMESTLIRGRWQSSRVAKLYISDGLSYLPDIQRTPVLDRFLNAYWFWDVHQG